LDHHRTSLLISSILGILGGLALVGQSRAMIRSQSTGIFLPLKGVSLVLWIFNTLSHPADILASGLIFIICYVLSALVLATKFRYKN